MNDNAVDITIPVPWGMIAGRTYGEERNSPVLCIHGRCDNLESFNGLIPLLPQNLFFVCIDLPGHGRSSHADKGYILDLPWYALAVKRVVDHFKWSNVYLLGHSFGGLICFFLSSLYPELVLKLVMIDTLMNTSTLSKIASDLRNVIFDKTLKLEKRLSYDEAPTYTLDDFIKKMKQGRGTEITTSQIIKMAERNLKKVGDNHYMHTNDQRLKILLGYHQHFYMVEQLENMGSSINCPILIILAKHSIVMRPQNNLTLSPFKKNTTITVVEGDHDVHISQPQKVATIIIPFLSGETKSKL